MIQLGKKVINADTETILYAIKDFVLRRDGSVEIVCIETGTLISKCGFDELSDINNDLKLKKNKKSILKFFKKIYN